LHRTESRGAHYRDDFPETDNQSWLHHITITGVNGRLELGKRRVDLSEIRP
jgi:succinate dehydrogenase/fumarate reductase flavoprotein subunit